MIAISVCNVLKPNNRISITAFTFPPSICYEVMGPDAMILVFWMLSLNQLFCSPLSSLSRGSLVPLCFLPLKLCHLHIWGCWYFSQQSWFQPVTHSGWHFTQCVLHISWINRVKICSLVALLSQFWTSQIFHVIFKLTHIKIFQKAGKMVWYSHLFKNLP